jgi:hypothetical protein
MLNQKRMSEFRLEKDIESFLLLPRSYVLDWNQVEQIGLSQLYFLRLHNTQKSFVLKAYVSISSLLFPISPDLMSFLYGK